MKINVKTLKGTHFEIQVKSEDTVADVKKTIETVQGEVYPASQQMLIHQGKVLTDSSTLDENKVTENGFIVIMLSKTKAAPGGSSTTAAAPATQVQTPVSTTTNSLLPVTTTQTSLAPSESNPAAVPSVTSGSVYGQATSTLVAGIDLEATIQQILDMGGGSWDRQTVIRALRAAFNNPERAVEYLYSGIPVAEVLPVAQASLGGHAGSVPAQAPVAIPSGGPNANPLNLFPQGLPAAGANAGAGNLDFLRNSQQFQALRTMVQANPQILQPMLRELGKQNPHLMRLIQEHQADFLRLMNEPIEGEGNLLGEAAAAMPQAVTVTPEEREAIERLEAMGFERALVLEVYFACNKNEELAANYLLDHMHEFEE